MTKNEYIEQINKLLAEAHEEGHDLYVETLAVDHPFPKWNPCADEPDKDTPKWKQIIRTVTNTVATDCKCCNGIRIIATGILGLGIGLCL